MTDFLKRLNSWLATVPSTNMKIVSTVGLYYLTFVAWALAVLLQKPIDDIAFGMWLGFLAGLGGFALAQFSTERKTDYGYIERTNQAKSPTSPSTTTVTPNSVTVTTANQSEDKHEGN